MLSGAARLYVLRCCSTPDQKNKLYAFTFILNKIEDIKISNPFSSFVGKKKHKKMQKTNKRTMRSISITWQHCYLCCCFCSSPCRSKINTKNFRIREIFNSYLARQYVSGVAGKKIWCPLFAQIFIA